MYRGSVPCVIDAPPRIVTFALAPGAPLAVTILRPAALPCKACKAFIAGVAARSLAETEETDPVRSDFFTVP
ncbi:hypothetical protein D3C86_1892620 [compost metagenome]